MIKTTPQLRTEKGRVAIIGLPLIWLSLFFAAPMLIIFRMSLSQPVSAQPPYKPLFDWSKGIEGFTDFLSGLELQNYLTILSDDLYLSTFLTSLRIAAIGTLVTLLIGYPMALAMARAPARLRLLLVALIILPFWTSFLIRIYAWIGILKQEGLLNHLLLSFGIITAPLNILNTEFSVQIGIAYSYLPFMVLPLYASLEKQDHHLIEAAIDLGCPPWKAFWLITLPLSWTGILGGCTLVFIPALGEFIIPDLLGGSETLMIGRLIWSEFFSNRDWPMASTIAILLLVIMALPMLIARRNMTMSSTPL